MASETVDPIDWLHPPPHTGQYPLCSTYCALQCWLGCKSQDLLHWVSRDRATFGIPDQRTACVVFINVTDHRKCEITLGGGHCGQRLFFYTGTPASHGIQTLVSSMTCMLHRSDRYHLHHRGKLTPPWRNLHHRDKLTPPWQTYTTMANFHHRGGTYTTVANLHHRGGTNTTVAAHTPPWRHLHHLGGNYTTVAALTPQWRYIHHLGKLTESVYIVTQLFLSCNTAARVM